MSEARAIFFEETHALAAVRRLQRDGYDATVVRERLQGEDDDEDHPWAVLSDAPDFALETLVDEFDGWLDRVEPDPVEPLVLPPLPVAPKRIKRPGTGGG